MSGKQQSQYAEILLSCIEEKYFKEEIIMEHHSFARIISGEMKVKQGDSSYILSPGDTLFFPAHQISTLIKQPKDGLPYRAVVLFFTPERLKDFYLKNPVSYNSLYVPKIKKYQKDPLLESFFASLVPYFDLEKELPEKVISVKIEEAIAILRTMDTDIDNLLADFSQSDKINLAEFMERNYMFNMPLENFGRLTGRSLTTFKRDFKKASTLRLKNG